VTRRVRFEAEATQEMYEAALWYERRRENLGIEFLEAIDAALELIRRWPESAPPSPWTVERLPARRAPVARFPFGIIYIHTPKRIRVLAIAHSARQPGYWLNRD
jgi:toxin ParE1/3/4